MSKSVGRPKYPRVLIVEDQRMELLFLKELISKKGKYKIIYTTENASLAEIYCLRNPIHLILMDICTAERESGLKAAEIIKKKYPEIKIIIITSMPDESFIRRAKEIGCESFWYKNSEDYDLIDIMDRTMKGESIYPESSPAVNIGVCKSDKFTENEITILRYLVEGLNYREIGEKMEISEFSVKYHLKKILKKTGYDNPLKLVVALVEKKFILPGY
ncbi:MAG: response regulator transcription factor [Tissierellia bacterium]|nr:response regulator transcription factor [Tissierellia bacterium]